MHAFIISSLPAGRQVSSPDVLIISPETTIGIDEVRQIQSFLSRKPIGEKNMVYVLEAHLLTIPAQNALLKMLEEPPGNAEIFLITKFADSLLPTVLSRVQIIKPETTVGYIDTSDTEKLIKKIMAAKIGERLEIIDTQNFTRDSALEFLDQLEQLLHANLNLHLKYDLIIETRKYLKANVSVKLAMDNLVINIVNTTP